MPVNNKANIERYTDPHLYSFYEIFIIHGGHCHICGMQIDYSAPRQAFVPGWKYGLQLDHVIPLTKGGSDELINVKPSHGICNLTKGNRTNEPKKHPRYAPVDTSYRKKLRNKISVD
jgi:5-methylcytosine-specific restriction endonuclease McrA